MQNREYPRPTAVTTTTSAVKLPTAVLSTSLQEQKLGQVRKRQTRRPLLKSLLEWNLLLEKGKLSSDKDGVSMQVDNPAEKKAEPELSFEILTNPATVVPAQEKFIKFLEESRYTPIKSAAAGFVLLKDLRPEEPGVLSLTDAPSSTASTGGGSAATQQGSGSGSGSGSAMAVDEEPQPPQAFEYSR